MIAYHEIVPPGLARPAETLRTHDTPTAPETRRNRGIVPKKMQSVLTMRERQVAGLVLQGLTNRAIAAELSISENTVEAHMTSILGRLGIRSRHQIGDLVRTRRAIRRSARVPKLRKLELLRV